MKRYLMCIAIFSMLFLASGCTAFYAPESISDKNTSGDNSEKASHNSKTAVSNDEPNTPNLHGIYPEKITQSLETLKFMKAGTAIRTDGKTFFIVSFGPKTGTGYHAKITEIREDNDKLIVEAELKHPEKPSTADSIS